MEIVAIFFWERNLIGSWLLSDLYKLRVVMNNPSLFFFSPLYSCSWYYFEALTEIISRLGNMI